MGVNLNIFVSKEKTQMNPYLQLWSLCLVFTWIMIVNVLWVDVKNLLY